MTKEKLTFKLYIDCDLKQQLIITNQYFLLTWKELNQHEFGFNEDLELKTIRKKKK